MDGSIHVLETQRTETNGLIHGECHNDLYLVLGRTAFPQSSFLHSASDKQDAPAKKEFPEIQASKNPKAVSIQQRGVTQVNDAFDFAPVNPKLPSLSIPSCKKMYI